MTKRLPVARRVTILLPMFLVTEADTTAIRDAFNQAGELSAASSCAAGSLASPTTRRRGNALGASPDGDRYQPLWPR